ncbi:MAG: M1 family metallopeptidase [Planctomycetota bacterium]
MRNHPAKFLAMKLMAWILFSASLANSLAQEQEFTEQDRLRGSVTPEREWWDLQRYELDIEVFPEEKRLEGSNKIQFQVLKPAQRMQIDLQEPMKITKVLFGEEELGFERNGNVYSIDFTEAPTKDSTQTIEIQYEGTPVESKRPPWSGGLTWQKDKNGKHFIATTCQGDGASLWWPCKDHGYDEPDRGVGLTVTVPEDLVAVANGRLVGQEDLEAESKRVFEWNVTKPINNYCVNVNIGDYVNFSDTFEGEGGELDMQYWVLRDDKEIAQKQFREAPRTIEAFEYWFGKYPFYEDSYKLVEVPYLGMEHQSSVTYGNGFQNGYRGTDLSGTGVGMLFDFIVVHESGHEWFGNNISMKDVADMWIHESFTNYSENLFVEYHFSEREAQDYVIGCRKRVGNDKPIIGVYNVNQSGSGDMYYKGGNMLHSMRHTIDDTKKWREILRGLNETFWHQTVTTEQVESYISEQAGIDFGLFFDQYLRGTKIPEFKYSIRDNKMIYRYENVVKGYSYRIRVQLDGNQIWLTPKEEEQTLTSAVPIESVEVDRNFYVTAEQVTR